MSEEKRADQELTFGEKLLGMQGFSAERAQRYRAEIDRLLVHRLSTYDRCVTGVMGILVGAVLLAQAVVAATSLGKQVAGLDESRWLIVTAFAASAVMSGGWLLYIALQGGYDRRLGEWMGMLIVLVFGGGLILPVLWMALGKPDEAIHTGVLLAGGAFVVLVAGGLLIALLRRMHRQTQEKLLRIEYHLAELMERGARQGGGDFR